MNGRLRLVRMTLWLLGLSVMIVSPLAARADDAERVERYLARLGLVDLQILQLEDTLAGKAVESRTPLARRLADLYAAELMTSSGDPDRYQDLLARIGRLTGRFPAANTPALQVMLLQADYNRAESLVGVWLDDPQEETSLQTAREILERIAPLLDRFQVELESHVSKLQDEIDKLSELPPTQPRPQSPRLGVLPKEEGRDDRIRTMEAEAARLEAVTGRARYFAAWSHYYLGLTLEGATAAGKLTRGRDLFRLLLEIPEGNYDSLEAELLGLDIVWRARALIGLGLTHAALDEVPLSRSCFKLLEDPSVAASVREEAAFWYVRGLLNGEKYEEAGAFAQQQIDRMGTTPTLGKVSLCAALVRAGYAQRGPGGGEQEATLKRLGQLGLRGLVRLQQDLTLDKLIEQYRIPLLDSEDFLLRWLAGKQLFAAAQDSKEAADYERAAEVLREALALPGSSGEPLAAAKAHYTIGWCLYSLEQLEAAAAEFEQSVGGLRQLSEEDAAKAAWMAFYCYHKMIATRPQMVPRAVALLKRIQADFPDHPYAKKAGYLIPKLLKNTSPEESIRQLRKVPPSAENYLTARYDLCMMLHQEWNKHRSEKAAANRLAGDLESAVKTFQAAAAGKATPEQSLRVLLLAADVALNGNEPQAEVAAQYLAAASPLADQVDPGNRAAAEFHYRQLQLARHRGDAETRRQHAGWLVENGQGSPYEQPALITTALAVEEELKSAPAARRAELVGEAKSLYGRLSKLLGSRSAILKSNKNARVAASKAAQYAVETKDYAAASQLLDPLLAAFPADKVFLKRAGIARTGSGDHPRALEAWRTLLAGLRPGSEEWYEAKYYQLNSLLATDREQARKVWRQFKLLHPQLGPAAWQPKFKQLESQLN